MRRGGARRVGRDQYASGDDTHDFLLLLSATVDIVRHATAIEPERLIHRGRHALELVGRPDAVETLELRAGRSPMRPAGLGEDDLPAALVGGWVPRRATPRAVAKVLVPPTEPTGILSWASRTESAART